MKPSAKHSGDEYTFTFLPEPAMLENLRPKRLVRISIIYVKVAGLSLHEVVFAVGWLAVIRHVLLTCDRIVTFGVRVSRATRLVKVNFPSK